MNKVVHISRNGTPDSNSKTVSKANDTISWTADGNGGPWVVTFSAGTPISVGSVTIGQGSASTQYSISGIVGVTYTYTIAAEGSGGGQDPDIVVEQ